MALTWQGVMTISVHRKLRPDPCKSLYAPNIVEPILAHFRISLRTNLSYKSTCSIFQSEQNSRTEQMLGNKVLAFICHTIGKIHL
jgi:hypothetical protein